MIIWPVVLARSADMIQDKEFFMEDNDKMLYEVPRLESIDMPFVVKGDDDGTHAIPEPLEDIFD